LEASLDHNFDNSKSILSLSSNQSTSRTKFHQPNTPMSWAIEAANQNETTKKSHNERVTVCLLAMMKQKI
jgi:hypothetical protein